VLYSCRFKRDTAKDATTVLTLSFLLHCIRSSSCAPHGGSHRLRPGRLHAPLTTSSSRCAPTSPRFASSSSDSSTAWVGKKLGRSWSRPRRRCGSPCPCAHAQVPVLPFRSKLGGHLLDGGGQLEVEVDERI
jgi:hypothetical protein